MINLSHPKDSELPEAEPEIEASKSPLGAYLKLNGIKMAAMARALGVSYKSIQDWTRGEAQPGLVAVFEIERLTKGVVPVESWLGTARNKSQMAVMRSAQPEEVQRMTMVAAEKTKRQEESEALIRRQHAKEQAVRDQIETARRNHEEIARLKEEFEGPQFEGGTDAFAKQIIQEAGLDSED